MSAAGPRTLGACSVALLLALGVLAASGESFAQARPFLPGTIADPATWRGAAPAGAVTSGPNGPELTIRQTTPRATLDWLRFDIGRGETVRFDQQGNRDWAALNRVLDPTGRPSQIAGRMVADGQIYLINQNGIVFTPTAQVDVNSLIASTLTVNPDAFLRGLLSVRQGTAQFELGSGNPDARIEVQGIRGPDGRTLVQAATINAQDGGRIFLLAAKEVVNAGRLVVRDGQVILAAGEKAYLFAPAEGSGSGLRGLFVEVDGGTKATNLGEIVTARGNTTMIGLAVNQSGRISANSAELGNGSVWLLARSGLFFDSNGARRAANAGTVTLSKDSTTELRPEGGGTGVVDSVSLNPSEVRIEGARIHLQGDGRTGATVSAPGGRVSILASAQPGVLPESNARDPVAPADSRLLIDGGARVDVSGIRGVEVSASRNVVGVELRGDVVADAPLLRDSPLAGQTLYVDVRTGSPLFGGADTVQRVAASQIRRTIDERSTSGGTVSLQSDGDLVVNPGAAFGIAGGTVRYLPGELRVSRLSDGRSTLSASQATPDRSYAFVVDRYQTYDARWNVRRVYDGGYRSPVDPGYVDGRPAGSLLISAPFTSWAGTVEAGVEVGAAQRQSPPAGGLFSIGERNQLGQRFADYRVLSPLVLTDSLAQAIAAVSPDLDRAAVFGTAEAPIAQRIDGSALAAGGVSRVELLSNASVTVAPGAPLVLPTGGRITLSANRVEIGRDLRVPSARGEAVVLPSGSSVPLSGIEITAPITAGNLDPATGGPTAAATGAVVVGAGVSIDASARWVVDPAGAVPATAREGWLRDGGSVRIAGATDVRLGQGARVDASGGALRDASRRLTGGDGGRIALQVTGRGEVGDPPPPASGTLSIGDATLRSNGFAQNGTLQLNAPNVVVGAVPETAVAADRLVLAPSFFGTGAFGRYEINAVDTLAVGPGRIAPRQFNFGTDQRSGGVLDEAALREIGAPRLLDDAVRRPVSLSFAATSPYRATLAVDRAAVVDADPRASLRFTSDVRLAFDGTATARGGSVEISTGRATRDTPLALRPDEVLRLGASASVDVSGIDLPVTDAAGRVTGAVLAGGTVDIGAARGALGIEPGARIDVSGAAGLRDTVTTASAADAAPARTALVSDAGRVSIGAGAGGYAAPTLVARRGGAGASAATVEVRHDTGGADSSLPRILTVTDSASVRTAATAASTTLATDPAVRVIDPATGDSRLELRVDARSIAPDGVPAGSLALSARDRVLLDTGAPVIASRSLQVSTAELAVSPGTARASLSAPAVQVGQPISQSLPVVATPSAGDARLAIDAATTVDFLGRVAISGARQVDVRTDGDIRFSGQYEQVATPTAVSRGELAVGGALSLTGRRLYPTTLSDYIVRSTAPDGRITLGAVGAEAALPLSALGSLTLSAATVAGQARLYAPLGTLAIQASTAIDLAAGSLLSVSGADSAVPVGQALSGFDWVYQVDASNRAPIAGLPAKAISLSAPSIDLREGARVDVRGGGDLLGREFIRGQTGSIDVLAAPNVFAVMPGGGGVAPRDAAVAIEDAAARAAGTSAFRGALPAAVGVQPGAAPRPGDSITVGDSPLLAAGTYTLLPARYGLLPGSRLVVLARPGTVPNGATRLVDGSWWVPAYRGNAAGERDAGWSSAAVLDADALARWSRYDQVTGSTYFGAKAGAEGVDPANVAADAGRLSLEGRTRLALAGQLQLDGGKPLSVAADGSIVPAAAAGARGTLELSADRLSIGGSATPGAVDVSTGFLASLLPRTLSLGVTTQAGGTPAIRATAVEVAPGVALTGERVIVGATEQVRIGAGASLSAPPSGAARRADAPDTPIAVNGSGALLSALGDTGERLARGGAALAGGTIELESGARIAGARADLDAARLAVSPQAAIDAPDVRIAADRLRFGGGPSADPASTAFDAAQSAVLSSRSRFEAVARSGIALAGDLRLGAESTERIRLQAPELVRDPTSGTGDAVVRAARVEISGTGPAVDAPPVAGNGSGMLSIASSGGPDAARSGVVLSGRTSFAGFGAYALSAAGTEAVPGRVVLDGAGSLRTDAPTSITANAVVGSAAAEYSVASAGALSARGPARPDAAAGAGARIELTASSIDVGTAIIARSGSVTLNATGAAQTDSVTLRPGAVIDASGASAQVFDQRLDASGGRIDLSARAGSVVAEGGATMDVSAVAGMRGGTVSLSAAAGRVTAADATLRGARPGEAPGASGASLQVDADRVDRPERLLGAASAGGFGRELSVRQRTGDLRIGTDAAPAALAAASIQLSADAGRLEFTGSLGGVPGASSRAALLSNERVVLGDGTRIAATGGADGSEGGRGGSVLLSGRNGFAFGNGVNVSAAASPVAGPMGADGGTVALRFDGVAAPTLLQPGSSTPTLVAPGGRIVLTGVQRLTAGATLGQADVDATRGASEAFVGQRATLVSALGLAADAPVIVRPELLFTGAPGTPVSVTGNVNLAGFRAGGAAGVLTIRSLSDLEITGRPIVSSRGLSAVISDGFVDGGARAAPLADPQGWTLRLVAGADAASADPMAVRPASDGDLVLGADRAIRTSTGDISLAAARDIRIGQPDGTTPATRDAAVYTAGTPAPAIAAFELPSTAQRPAYAFRGGDVSIRAGRDVVGAESGQLASNWLLRRGAVDPSGNVPVRGDANSGYVYAGTSWGPRVDAFRQNVGALGGGGVDVMAGRDVSNLSVAVPTSGRFHGPSDRLDPTAATMSSTVLGGGGIGVEAGRDVISGSVTLQSGVSAIRAGRSVTGGRDVFGSDTGTVVQLGNAALTVEAGANARIERAIDPTMLPQPIGAARTYFSTQGDATRLTIRAAGGDASLRSDDNGAVGLFAAAGVSTLTGDLALSAAFGPHTLTLEALTRDVIVGNVDVRLAPSAQGDLRLIAARNVTGTAAGGFEPATVMLDYDPSTLFAPRAPVPETTIDLTTQYTRVIGGTRAGAAVPLHAANATVARVYAGRGDVSYDPSSPTAWQLESAKPIEVRAGRDIVNLALAAKHPDADDRTLVSAGRDIVAPVPRTATNEIATSNSRIRVGGAGLLELIAGRDIRLGSGGGVETRGNLDDSALPVAGASIVLVAGLPDGPDYRAFLQAYVAPGATRGRGYDAELLAFLKTAGVATDGLDSAGRWAALQALPEARRAVFARLAFFTELREAARAAADPANPSAGDYQRAYDALAVLFPKDGVGNIELVFSKVRTERGGDIQMLAPGEVCRGAYAACTPGAGGEFVGNIVAGLLTPQPVRSATRLAPTDFGILTLGGGSIQGVAGSDVAVNQSRVFTVAGGDILLWSSFGDIDAGRGSRTAIASPPPVVTVDPQGNIRVEVPGAAAGSGIGTLITRADVQPGSVDLYAPRGVIDAGEAGIRVSGSAFLGAGEIRNAGAISAAGPSVGVPAASTSSNVSLASAGSSAASATRSAGDAADRDASDAASRQRTASKVLILEFLGFGDEGEEAYRRRQQRGR